MKICFHLPANSIWYSTGMKGRSIIVVCSACLMLVTVSCTSREYVIPEPIASQIDTSLTFDQLQASPTSHVGKVVALGGEVLNATRLPDGTSMESCKFLWMAPSRRWQCSNLRADSSRYKMNFWIPPHYRAGRASPLSAK